MHQNRPYKYQSSAGDQERLPWILQRNAVDMELSKANLDPEEASISMPSSAGCRGSADAMMATTDEGCEHCDQREDAAQNALSRLS